MADNTQTVFRKKTLDRIASPEQLTDYLRVTNPGIWVILVAVILVSNIVLYYLAAQSGIGQSSYFAFTASYGMLMGAFMSLSGIALSAAQIQPILEMAEPFRKIEPETAENKEIVTHISGSIDLDHVSFRYDESGPYILNDLSLSIKPGEYVAVVGRTGCGQRQRLMIARVIAPKPKLLIFDEATSALDNKTQKQVSEALDKMGCTRIVIAHRLSTIKHCDRILVLDGGRIVEDGTYDELIDKGGFFAVLVDRQRLDTDHESA